MVKIVYEPPSLADWVDTRLACLDRLLVTIERFLESAVKIWMSILTAYCEMRILLQG